MFMRLLRESKQISIFKNDKIDEYSFVLKPSASQHRRRRAKIETLAVSLFTSTYVLRWTEFMGADNPLQYAPSFDARIVLYPTVVSLLLFVFFADRCLFHVRLLLSSKQCEIICHGGKLIRTSTICTIQHSGHLFQKVE